ncbi:MAG: saccharopine dehydrogenase family protein [Tenacibaculum sp.]
MRNILIIGAGRSTSLLVKYLLDKSKKEHLHLLIGDVSKANALSKTKDNPSATALELNVFNKEQTNAVVKKSDIVISMLPAHIHIELANICIELNKHLVTASYVSKQMQALDMQVRSKGLIFMNEVGLDPGIDHMSAMQVIDRIKKDKGKLLLFESFCGGLIAPESNDNLWNYKFTWNPRNVVLAGQGGASMFIQEGSYKYIPYHKLFRRTEFLNIDGNGKFEAYANRDSLKYRSVYGLDDIKTMYRGTIRKVGFSRAWNVFVQLGMTDDTYTIENSEEMSYRDFTNLFLAYSPNDSVELKFRSYLKIDQDDIIWDKFVELNLFSSKKKVGLKKATPAQILQKILADSWTLKPEDKDMIIMHHIFGYEKNGQKKQIESSMLVKGYNQKYTAMAKTVGLPVAMTALRILNGEITNPGVQLPIDKEVYEPVLNELQDYGIVFNEKQVPYLGYQPEGRWFESSSRY